MSQSLILSAEHANQRLDKALAELLPQFSRSYLQQAIKQGLIQVDGQVVQARYAIRGDETISYDLAEPVHNEIWQPEAMALDIIYEDEEVLVINKPVGLVVHPGAGNWTGTLVNGLLHYCPALEALPRAGIVHRLDKETSGLMVVAKTREAHHALTQELQAREVQREYLALVYGEVTAGGTIEGNIGRDPRDRLKMALLEEGREAVTHYRLAERFAGFTLLRLYLETGRTHQIRVHLASIHYPIVGDPLYGRGLRLPKGASEELVQTLKGFKHQALHAARLSFTHPTTQEEVSFEAPLPEDFSHLLSLLRP
ncbi:MAG: rluD [Gammaproteobacteria bacterium]|jgi:23S rRNA pseudouridine1911/1915/1917 synthase|nr:rluD [Gammaproteobacteria bacterium]